MSENIVTIRFRPALSAMELLEEYVHAVEEVLK